jgi:hypothetical protein
MKMEGLARTDQGQNLSRNFTPDGIPSTLTMRILSRAAD